MRNVTETNQDCYLFLKNLVSKGPFSFMLNIWHYVINIKNETNIWFILYAKPEKCTHGAKYPWMFSDGYVNMWIDFRKCFS